MGKFRARMGFYLYQCEVIILGILKERSTKNLIKALKKYEDSKSNANMEDLKSFMSALCSEARTKVHISLYKVSRYQEYFSMRLL